MKGYWLFPALLSLSLTVLCLTQGHWLAFLVVLLCFVRLFATGSRTIFLGTCSIGVITFVICVITINNNQTRMRPTATHYTIVLDPNTVRVDGDQLQFYGDVIKVGSNGNLVPIKEKIVCFYRLKSKREQSDWQDVFTYLQLEVIGELELPEKNRNFAQFNYQDFLKQKKIHWLLSIREFKTIEKRHFPFWSIIKKGAELRQLLIKHLKNIPNEKVVAYILALLLGEGEALTEEIRLGFSKIGLVHLLSISGFHIHYLVKLFRQLFLRMGVSNEAVTEALLVVLPIYGAMANWQTGVFRAVVMSWILLLAKRCCWSLSGLDALSLTTILALWCDPYQLLSISFQLSYLLTFLLMLLNESLQQRIPSKLKREWFLSFIMLLASMPVLSYSFYEFSWIVVATTFLFTPVFSYFLLPILTSILFLSLILFDAFPFLWLVEIADDGIKWLEEGIRQLNALGSFLLVTGRPKSLSLVFFILASGFFLWAFEQQKKRVISIIGVIVAFVFLVFSGKIEKEGKVVVIDVGQGDAILIEEPFGKGAYLIDTGGEVTFEKQAWQIRKKNTSVAKRKLIPALKAEGITTLKTVFLTHGDADHIGSLVELSKEITIERLIFPKGTQEKALLKGALVHLAKQGIHCQTVVAGSIWQPMSTLSLQVLYPFEKGKGENNDSLILYGKIGGLSWLFTGDIEAEGERLLLEKYPHLQVDCLKVAHHGSKTSTTELFVTQLKPKVALISCGFENRFKHPSSEVLSRLEKEKTLIYRTDLQGAIYYRYVGNQVGQFSTILN